MVRAQLSPEAADRLQDMLAEAGVTVAALLEALATELDDLDELADGLIERAREITAERRRRK